MFFQSYSPPSFLVFALVLFPESFGFELMPVAFKILESTSQSDNDHCKVERRFGLTQLPAGEPALPS